MQWKIPNDPINLDRKAQAIARNSQNCSTTTLVGVWNRATQPPDWRDTDSFSWIYSIFNSSISRRSWNLCLCPSKGRVRLSNRTNFRKSAKGGVGSFSIQKFILQILGTLNRFFWAWNWYKRVISGLRVGFFSTIVLYYNCITPISGNHVHAFHTIQPSYLLAYMQPYMS